MTPVTDNEIIKSEESSTFVEEKLRLTSELLAQSPPGEFNDVLHGTHTSIASTHQKRYSDNIGKR
jgi:hypothetical protein